MAVATKGIFIVGAKRTPFGTFGGVFRNTSATELQTHAFNAALKSAGVAPDQVDSVNVGQVMSGTQSDGIYVGRHAALKAGIPQDKPVLGVNRLCGSGFQSVVNSAQDILTGVAKISLAGGVENMSQAPFAVRNIRFGTALGATYAFEDTLWAGLTDSYCNMPMGDILTGVAKISLAGGVENMSQAPFAVRNIRFGTALGATYAFEDTLWAGLTDSYCNMPMGDILTGVAKISLAGGVENMSQAPFAVRNIRFGTALGATYAFEDTLWAGLTDSYCNMPMGDILTGVAKISLAGGVENMSQAPFAVRNIRFGTALGTTYAFEDTLWAGLTDSYCNMPMGVTAEKLGGQFGITRDEVDKFALRSQQRWKKANDEGVFKAEIEPITLTVRRKQVSVGVDEHPRPETTIEGLNKLGPVFKKDGLVTAGTASGISDGAGALVVAGEEAAKALKPLARLVGWSFVGVDPSIMGFGPVPAIQNLLKVTGLKLDDIDLIEINEAFVAQVLSCAKALKLDPERLNLSGGATALGHPLGASGSRITAHLVHELKRRGLKRGIGSACIGGGQGIAVLVEAV